MVIPFYFTFKFYSPQVYSPQVCIYLISFKVIKVIHLIRSSKFLILQFLRKCCKLHSVFKILSKSHMSEIFFNFKCVCSTNAHRNYDFLLLKSLNSPNLCINGANIWYPDYQNKKFISAFSVVSRVFIYASNKSLCGTLMINLGKTQFMHATANK